MTDGCRWVYTLRDPETGVMIAEGTSTELTKKGYFEKAVRVDYAYRECLKTERKKPLKYQMSRISAKEWRLARRKAAGLETDERAERRKVRVYSCYNAAGELLGRGTAQQLKDSRLFGCDGTVHDCYRNRGGVYKAGGVARMEMRLEERMVRHLKQVPEEQRHRKLPIGGVHDPSPLAYDVHDLIGYNKSARAAGKPELSYGWWAAKGKPEKP